MTQIALFLVSVFGVTWTLLLLLRPVAAQGELWAVLAWILPTAWAPTITALTLTRSMGGAGLADAGWHIRHACDSCRHRVTHAAATLAPL